VEQAPDKRQALDPGRALSRRKIVKRAATVAAAGTAGVAGGSALTGVFARPAHAATAATTVQQGALAPEVVNLTDAATIAVDASQGNDYRLTIAGDRTLATPSNPTDGQKVIIQVTQGSGGGFTLSYGSGYEFSAALPQPPLSTAAGDTDLLAFVYNAAKSRWLLAAFVPGFASTAVIVPPPPAGTFRLFPSTNGPSSPVSYGGSFLAGVLFEVTSGGVWFDGYWWWVCPTGQSAAAQQFALWAVYNGGIGGALVPGSTVTSGTLAAGQWNYVPLPTPIPLAMAACYNACTGFTGSFPDTNGQYGSGGAYAAGITNGPLTAFSDQSGSLPAPFTGLPQGVFSVAGTDPTANMPANGSSSDNFWMDVQVDTNPPSGASYRLWPSYPILPGGLAVDTNGYTLATEFSLSQSCTLDKIWFYSASGAVALPTQCGIWDTASQSVVSGTDETSPSWSGGGPGSGWVSCAYDGVTLPAGDYKAAVFYGGGSNWYHVTTNYWGGDGPGASGITAGPLTAPGQAAATSPGQSTYNPGSWAYPLSYGAGGGGENFWVDVEVKPA
jgi:hypothetical protein